MEKDKNQPVGYKISKNNILTDKKTLKPVTPPLSINKDNTFHINKEKEFNGIVMGVLDNGVAYLTARGLAKACGISLTTLEEFYEKWNKHLDKNIKPENKQAIYIQKSLKEKEYYDNELYIVISDQQGIKYAFPEPVCMAFLEYYTFEAKTKDNRNNAKELYKKFASLGFRKFIYQAVGYNEDTANANYYKQLYYDRASILKNQVPANYFGIFHELGGFILDLINNNIPVNNKIIPDISVGQAWANNWKENNYNNKYGKAKKYNHLYPDSYPQSKSNPQEAWCYPIEALGIFKKWFYNTYLSNKFPRYMTNLIKNEKISLEYGNEVIKTFSLPKTDS